MLFRSDLDLHDNVLGLVPLVSSFSLRFIVYFFGIHSFGSFQIWLDVFGRDEISLLSDFQMIEYKGNPIIEIRISGPVKAVPDQKQCNILYYIQINVSNALAHS